MSSLKEFMDEFKESPTKSLPESGINLPAIQLALTGAVGELLAPFPYSSDEQRKFSQEVSGLIQDEVFLSEFSDQLSEPLNHESEDEFVKRGSDVLRQMLYEKFKIKG